MDHFEICIGMFFIILCYCFVEFECKSKRLRRWWVRPIHLNRNINGYFESVYVHMKNSDPEEFFKHTRMSRTVYDQLLDLAKHNLQRQPKRLGISAECRLALTLSFLSQGVPQTFLSSSFKIGLTTVRNIILETCDVLWESLRSAYVCEPSTQDFHRIAECFQNTWDLPNCIGAVDGKHVNIQKPKNSGSAFYNYKSSFSIVLLAACDADYLFTYVDIGAYGSQSDGGILANSAFGKSLLGKKLPVPPPSVLPKSNIKFPYYFVSDAAFPLKENLMRPYPGKRLDMSKSIFNYRLSRARVVIENAFGILVARWRILRTDLTLFPENAERIVLATIALHNFVKRNEKDSKIYCPTTFVDHEDAHGNVMDGDWRQEIGGSSLFSDRGNIGSNNATRTAFQLRDNLKDYFVREGAIEKQKKVTSFYN